MNSRYSRPVLTKVRPSIVIARNAGRLCFTVALKQIAIRQHTMINQSQHSRMELDRLVCLWGTQNNHTTHGTKPSTQSKTHRVCSGIQILNGPLPVLVASTETVATVWPNSSSKSSTGRSWVYGDRTRPANSARARYSSLVARNFGY